MPKYKLPVKEPKTSARILTSVESLRAVQEKKRKKDEAAAMKEKRKLAREEARLEKAKKQAANKVIRSDSVSRRIGGDSEIPSRACMCDFTYIAIIVRNNCNLFPVFIAKKSQLTVARQSETSQRKGIHGGGELLEIASAFREFFYAIVVSHNIILCVYACICS